MRRDGENLWRPSRGLRITYLLIGVAFVAGTSWLYLDGEPLSLQDNFVFTSGDLAALSLLPIVLFRWRLVLECDELVFVFLRVRRVKVVDIVGAKCVAQQGLVFVCADGAEASFGALGNTAWGHKRETPTRADLVARTVLCAAASARGEAPPSDFRLPQLSGIKKAAIEGGVIAFVAGLFLGD